MPVKTASLSVCDDSVYCSLWSCGVEASLSDNITRRYQDRLRALQSQGALCLLSFIMWVFSIGAAADRQRERWRR